MKGSLQLKIKDMLQFLDARSAGFYDEAWSSQYLKIRGERQRAGR